MSHDTIATRSSRTRPGIRRAMAAVAIVTLSSVAGAAAAVRHDDGTIHLQVRLAERKLYVYAGDQTMSYDIAIGLGSKPTPTGNFHIRRIVWNPAWVPPAVSWARD